MKKIFLLLLLASMVSGQAWSQDEDDREKPSFTDNLFTGGSITISFFNKQTLLGANPILGYKLNDYVDAGLSFNFLYSGARDWKRYDDKIRQTTMGPGVFARVYPVSIIFLQGQFEHNFIKQKYVYPGGAPEENYKVDASSLLVGGGLAQGREKGGTTFYYISVLFDVLKNINSPYTRVTVNPNNPSQQRVDIVPVIRAGVNIGLGRRNER